MLLYTRPVYEPEILEDRLVQVLGNECVGLEEVQQHLRQAGSLSLWEENELRTLISAVRSKAERFTRLALVKQQRKLALTGYGTLPLSLPYGPHSSIDSVERVREGEEPEVLTPITDYQVSGLMYKQLSLPVTYRTGAGRLPDYLSITYTAGYEADTVPDEIRLALLKSIATEYKYRENITDRTIRGLSSNSEAWLAPFVTM